MEVENEEAQRKKKYNMCKAKVFLRLKDEKRQKKI